MLKHGILGLISNGDKTGYEIMTVFRDSLNHFWTAQTSQIYRELQTMEKPDGSGRPMCRRRGNPTRTCFPSHLPATMNCCDGSGTTIYLQDSKIRS